jgi:ElaB/YqjD/DUF883 family membrane-anchored ribosome-binding protein
MESDVLKTGSDMYQGKKEKITSDLSGAAEQAGQMVKEVGNKVNNTLQSYKSTLTDYQTQMTERARQAAGMTDEYVRMNPWKSLGVAAAAGLLVGILLSRR